MSVKVAFSSNMHFSLGLGVSLVCETGRNYLLTFKKFTPFNKVLRSRWT